MKKQCRESSKVKLFRPARVQILEMVKPHGVCGEVGVYKGGFSREILHLCDPKEMHLIDGWDSIEHMPEDTNGEPENHSSVEFWKSVFEEVKASFSTDPRVHIHKGTSKEVLSGFPNDHFDFLYLDGRHTYTGCKQDLIAAGTKVKVGGILGGHDCCHYFPGVMMAVLEFISDHAPQRGSAFVEYEPAAITSDTYTSWMLRRLS
jgi:hypothetical protein